MNVTELDMESLREKLKELRIKHRELDHEIMLLQQPPAMANSSVIAINSSINNPINTSNLSPVDSLDLRRMKKRKLLLKEMITKLESQLIPDLNA